MSPQGKESQRRDKQEPTEKGSRTLRRRTRVESLSRGGRSCAEVMSTGVGPGEKRGSCNRYILVRRQSSGGAGELRNDGGDRRKNYEGLGIDVTIRGKDIDVLVQEWKSTRDPP